MNEAGSFPINRIVVPIELRPILFKTPAPLSDGHGANAEVSFFDFGYPSV